MKFGSFAREALQAASLDGRVPIIEMDERSHSIESKNVKGLAMGSRGLLSMIQDTREVLI